MDIAVHIPSLMEADKTIGVDPAWHLDPHEGHTLRASVPLAVEGVIQEGLYLEGRCISDNPDQDISISLVYKPARGLSGPLCRVDWNPIQAHNNRGLISGPWRFKPIQSSHLHPFY